MDTRWDKFSRVLRAYTIEEKVMSVIILGMVTFLTLQSFVDFTRSSDVLVQGGGYTEGFVSDKPTLLNPLFVDFAESSRDISALIFSGLAKYDPEKKIFVDDLATLRISPDRTIYKFFLKKDLFWHDGQPLTADDVYFTFHDVIQSPEFQNPILHVNFEGIEVHQIDSSTIEFKLKKPNSFFITNMNVGILPKHLLSGAQIAQLPTNPFNLRPIGSGPYKIESPMEIFDDGKQKVTLSSFDRYYGIKPKISQIRFTVYPDDESLLKEKKSLNIISKVSSLVAPDLQKSGKFHFSFYELPQYTAVFFNMDRPLLKKSKIRVALLKAVDKTQLLKLFRDKIAVDTPLLELNQSDWIYKTNVKEAQGSLFDAGYKLPANQTSGIRKDSKNNPLQLVLLTRAYDQGSVLFEETKKVTDFLKSSWAAIGVDVTVSSVDELSFREHLANRDYDMILTGQGLGYNLDTYSYWHSSQASSTGLNLSNYESFAADQLIQGVRDTFDAGQKDLKLQQLAKVLAGEIPAIFLYRPQYIFANDDKVKGISLGNLAFPSDRFAHIERWCVGC